MKRLLTFSLAIVLLELTAAWGYRGDYLFIINWDGMRYDAIDQGLPEHLVNDLMPEGIFFEHLYNAWHTITSPGHSNIHTGNPCIYPNTGGEECKELGDKAYGDRWHLSHYYPSLMEAYVKEKGNGPADSVLAWVFGNNYNDRNWGYSQHPDYPDATPYTSIHAARKIVPKILDAELWDSIKTVLDIHQPDFFYVDFHNVDTYGHMIPDSGVAAYYRSIQKVDSITYEILNDYIPNSPKYARNTNVLIISDHGRHSDGVNNELTGHGCDCDGCRHVMGLLWGPDFKNDQVISESHYQTEYAHTLAHLLGILAPHARTSRIHSEWFNHPETEVWSPQSGGGEPISEDNITNSDPDIAISNNRRVHVVWCEDHRAIKYRYKGQGNWSATLTLATAEPGELLKAPRVTAIDSKVVTCWERFEVRYPGFSCWYLEIRASFDDGQSWTPIKPNTFQTAVMMADVALSKSWWQPYLLVAAAHAPHRGDRNAARELSVKKARSINSWEQTLHVSHSNRSRPRYLDLCANGQYSYLALEFFWYDHDNLEVVNYISENNGEDWTGPTLITDEDACGHYLHDFSPSGWMDWEWKEPGLTSREVRGTVSSECYPNPFNPATSIRYDLPAAGHVCLEVFNLKGQRVETLVDEHQLPGSYSATWNAEDYCSGLYLYKLTAEDYTETKKMLLVK